MSVLSVDQILKYVNQARTEPKKFAQYVQQDISQFKDNMTLPLYPGCDYSTNQGKGAWIQCKQVLDSMKPLPPYQLSKSLCLAADDHAADMAAHNFQGHTGSDGSTMKQRIYRRGKQVQVYGQQIGMGQNIGGDFKVKGRNHALNSVKSLLIDDGVSNRGHRKNLLSTEYRYIGISSRVVGDKIKVVMDFHTHDPALKNSSDNMPKQNKQIHYNENKGNNGGHDGFSGHGGFGGFGGQGGFSQGFGGKGFGGFNDDFDNNFGGFGGDHGGFVIHNNQGGFNKGFGSHMDNFSGNHGTEGGRYPVSTSSQTSTSTVNGRTKTVKITKIVYSDGSTETKQDVITH